MAILITASLRSGSLLEGGDICQQKHHIGYGWAIKLESALKKSSEIAYSLLISQSFKPAYFLEVHKL
jgi:hypothetical protein